MNVRRRQRRKDKVWDASNAPADIKKWNAAQEDWHTTKSSVDLSEGGKSPSRTEAKDGSEGFNFEGTYTRVVPNELIEYRMSDRREVTVEFIERSGAVLLKDTFDAETVQRQGCKSILDNFARHVEAKD